MSLAQKIHALRKKVSNADIVKVFSLTSLSTLVRMLTGFVSVKVVALIIGPQGIALLGQLNNFTTIVLTLATGGIYNGVTKYIATYKDDEAQAKRYIATAFRIISYCSLLIGLGLIVLAPYLSGIIFHSDTYPYLFILLGLSIFLYACNGMLLSILNGYKEFRRYVRINIADSLLGLSFTLCLVWLWGLKGALIATVTYQSVMVFITLVLLRGSSWLKLANFRLGFDRKIARQYLHYSIMTLVSSLTLPVVQIYLRGHVIATLSLTEAGWWEAMNRISALYLMVITTSFGVYYLPRLAELHEKPALRREIFAASKVILPLLLVGFSVLFFIRGFVIRLLFSADFLPMQDLFVWQMAGDFFKMASWLLGFLMVAKSMTKQFILAEILFSVVYLGISFVFLKMNGVVGITQAYFVCYVLYFIAMLLLFRDLLFYGKQRKPAS